MQELILLDRKYVEENYPFLRRYGGEVLHSLIMSRVEEDSLLHQNLFEKWA